MKRILSVFLALLTLLSVAALASCDKNDPAKLGGSVTIPSVYEVIYTYGNGSKTAEGAPIVRSIVYGVDAEGNRYGKQVYNGGGTVTYSEEVALKTAEEQYARTDASAPFEKISDHNAIDETFTYCTNYFVKGRKLVTEEHYTYEEVAAADAGVPESVTSALAVKNCKFYRFTKEGQDGSMVLAIDPETNLTCFVGVYDASGAYYTEFLASSLTVDHTKNYADLVK